MLNDKTVAKWVGLLFVTTMLAGIIDSAIALPLLGAAPEQLHDCRVPILAGVFLVLYMSLGVVGIAFLLRPILGRHSEAVASMYLSFRIIESVFLIAGALVSLFLLAMGDTASGSGAPAAASLGIVARLAVSLRMSAYQIAMAILGANSLALCALLLKSRLVPAWLAWLGLLGYALLLASAVLSICGLIDMGSWGGLLYVPGGLFELVAFPAWLIVKGFRSTAESAPVAAPA